jgi:radical SAM protein with 4Fe4S-binding SPASM domain
MATRAPAIGEPVIEVVAGRADGATVEIRWQGEEPAHAPCPDVVGLGEPLAAQFGAAKVRGVDDPQKALQDVAIDTGTLRAVAVGQPGFRTAFAKLEQGGLVWWAPVTFEIRPPLAVCQTRVDTQGGKVELTLRNNTDRPLTGSAMLACGSVRETPFALIWKEAPILQALRQRETLLQGRCGECEYRRLCGGCRGRVAEAHRVRVHALRQGRSLRVELRRHRHPAARR